MLRKQKKVCRWVGLHTKVLTDAYVTKDNQKIGT